MGTKFRELYNDPEFLSNDQRTSINKETEMHSWEIVLREYGYKDKDITEKLLEELIEVFRPDQKKEIFEGRLDLGDIDDWVYLERILGRELDKETAFGIIDLLWEKGIRIMDCGN